ncbi:MAG: aspartate aminotransferase family protein, partial [Bacteroidota bacterium]|nr:aspartate aminotransferase family protein [Bacteroidota bacterium]
EQTRLIIREGIQKGLIMTISGYYGNRINIVPSLIVNKPQIDQALAILDSVIKTVEIESGISS